MDEVAGGCPHLLLFVDRLLAEEEEKLKQLMKLKEEQEEYIIKTQREKQVLKQEMENKNKCLEEAQKQLEEVRVNRQRVDQDVMVSIPSVPHPSTPRTPGDFPALPESPPHWGGPSSAGDQAGIASRVSELCHAQAQDGSVAEMGQACPALG